MKTTSGGWAVRVEPPPRTPEDVRSRRLQVGARQGQRAHLQVRCLPAAVSGAPSTTGRLARGSRAEDLRPHLRPAGRLRGVHPGVPGSHPDRPVGRARLHPRSQPVAPRLRPRVAPQPRSRGSAPIRHRLPRPLRRHVPRFRHVGSAGPRRATAGRSASPGELPTNHSFARSPEETDCSGPYRSCEPCSPSTSSSRPAPCSCSCSCSSTPSSSSEQRWTSAHQRSRSPWRPTGRGPWSSHSTSLACSTGSPSDGPCCRPALPYRRCWRSQPWRSRTPGRARGRGPWPCGHSSAQPAPPSSPRRLVCSGGTAPIPANKGCSTVVGSRRLRLTICSRPHQ